MPLVPYVNRNGLTLSLKLELQSGRYVRDSKTEPAIFSSQRWVAFVIKFGLWSIR